VGEALVSDQTQFSPDKLLALHLTSISKVMTPNDNSVPFPSISWSASRIVQNRYL